MVLNLLDDYAFHSHRIAVEHGFYDGDFSVETALSKIALVHSELSETLEAIRKDQGSAKILEECADVFIRLADLVEALRENGFTDPQVSFDDVVGEKMAANELRPRLHGNLA